MLADYDFSRFYSFRVTFYLKNEDILYNDERRGQLRYPSPNELVYHSKYGFQILGKNQNFDIPFNAS